ncbi:DinB family protein [Actinosynnema sp.]|uniref:DinB family protein n=1 Tax=Actinosynnema sp. TaxID=1872144 RepID=UPI003F851953
MTTAAPAAGPANSTAEVADLVEALQTHRGFLRHTLGGVTREQLTARSTVSELTLGGIVKHLTAMEAEWMRFAKGEPHVMDFPSDSAGLAAVEEAFREEFRIAEDQTAEELLAEYARVAAETDAAIPGLDLDRARELPIAPWFEPGATRTVRRVLVHLIAETAQHAGHADIIRESIDGQKTMG